MDGCPEEFEGGDSIYLFPIDVKRGERYRDLPSEIYDHLFGFGCVEFKKRLITPSDKLIDNWTMASLAVIE